MLPHLEWLCSGFVTPSHWKDIIKLAEVQKRQPKMISGLPYLSYKKRHYIQTTFHKYSTTLKFAHISSYYLVIF